MLRNVTLGQNPSRTAIELKVSPRYHWQSYVEPCQVSPKAECCFGLKYDAVARTINSTGCIAFERKNDRKRCPATQVFVHAHCLPRIPYHCEWVLEIATVI